MLTCKQASKLVSQSLDRQLTLSEKVGLRFHLLICKFCKRFEQQLMLIKKSILASVKAIEQNEQIQLPNDAKTRITQAINDHQQP